MKKLVFMFVALAAMSFASCDANKTQEVPVATDSDSVVVDSAATDSAATDTAAVDSAAAATEEAPAQE